MWITLEQIQCLKAVSETGSLNGASEVLNKAKSAVSYSIARLEEQLGFEVLDRSQYRIRLTDKGEAFLVKGEPLLSASDSLKEEVQKIASGIEMRLSLSASAIYPTEKLHSVLKEVLQKFPSTELTFHREILSGEKMLSRDMVDVALFEALKNKLDFDYKKIGRVELCLAVAKNHPFLEKPRRQRNLEKLTEFPQIIQRSTLADDESIGIPENSKRWSVSDLASKKQLIKDGLGWGQLPRHEIEKELKSGEMIHLPELKYDHNLEIYICKKKGRPMGKVLDFIWQSF